MTEDCLAAYDAQETSSIAIQVTVDEVILSIARQPMDIVRSIVTVDRTRREKVEAQIQELLHCVLRMHLYTPHKQDGSKQAFLEQAEVLFEEWGK